MPPLLPSRLLLRRREAADALSSPPEPLLGPRSRSRARVGVGAGAALVLVAAALVGAVLIQAVQSASADGLVAGSAGLAGGDGGGGASGADADEVPGATVPDRTAPAAGGSGEGGSGEGGSGGGGTAAGAAGATGADGSASAGKDSDGGGGGAEPASGGAASSSSILVHVVGAVAAPGLFPLAAGSRVVDAVAAAHGFTEGADAAGVNLARVLTDGEQLVVPEQGEAPTGAAPGAAALSGGAGDPGPAAPVDLNTATSEQLETLPRVGPALAARILAWRSAHGRFARVADLGRVPGIGDRTLASLTPLVRV